MYVHRVKQQVRLMRRGFTLMELLVAIAIIAILAALIFPVFTTVRERGKSTQCISNLRQIGAGLSQYLADHDDRYPWAWTEEWVMRNDRHLPTLRTTLSPYVKDSHLWQCKSDTGEMFALFPDGSYANGFPPHTAPFYSDSMLGSSYMYWGLAECAEKFRPYPGRPASGIHNPTGAVVVNEIRPFHHRTSSLGASFDALHNALYCDGHVTPTRWEMIIKGVLSVTTNE